MLDVKARSKMGSLISSEKKQRGCQYLRTRADACLVVGSVCMMVSKCASLLGVESEVKRDRWLCDSVMSNQQTGCMIGG